MAVTIDQVVTINQLPTITPDGADTIPVYDTGGAVTGKAALADIRTATGAASLGANTFTGNQTIDKAAATLTLQGSGQTHIFLAAGDNAAGMGSLLTLANNNNPTTGAGGVIRFRTKADAYQHLWVDGLNIVRVGATQPTSANDTSGTVVGTQTSHERVKTVRGEVLALSAVFAALAAAAAHVARFSYTVEYEYYGESAEAHEGIILKEAAPETHRYGTDKTEAGYSAGKSLNTITLLGDLLRVVVDLAARVSALEQSGAGPQGGAP